ncbi:MAG: YceI family protein [Colwellia sp.]|nr:YceI family protein [Colwellia sp.]
MRFLLTIITAVSLLFVSPAFSAWHLDDSKSSLTFVSIKKGSIAENHRFKTFSATLNKKGLLSVNIALGSVDTRIPIRDSRMTEFLFEIAKFSQANFTAQINISELDNIAIGTSKRLSVSGNIDLHGQQQAIVINVLVAKLANDSMLVTTVQPVIIKAEDFALVAGINKLQALAKLPSIAYTVPVSFVLTFQQ